VVLKCERVWCELQVERAAVAGRTETWELKVLAACEWTGAATRERKLVDAWERT
jgi:hypothetical protein